MAARAGLENRDPTKARVPVGLDDAHQFLRSSRPWGCYVRRMSVLAQGNDDHPEAARKHAGDARVLLGSDRDDGAAYLAGYAVECAVKAVIIHDKSFNPQTGATDAVQLGKWHKTLSSKPYGHDLAKLLHLATTNVGARYAQLLPDPAFNPSVVSNWSEKLRYRGMGSIKRTEAVAYVEWAGVAEQAIIEMMLDGVL